MAECVPWLSIGITANFAQNKLDGLLPSSCRQEIGLIAKAIEKKVIELTVIHQREGMKTQRSGACCCCFKKSPNLKDNG